MNIKKLVAVMVTAVSMAAPLALAGPAEAKPSQAPCVRITAPGSHTVAVGETSNIHVRLSKACKGAKLSLNGESAHRVGIRHVLFSTAYYIPGEYKMTLRVNPPKGEGKTVTKTITYKVVA